MISFDDVFENQKDMEARILGAVIEHHGVGFQDFDLNAQDFTVPGFAVIWDALVELHGKQGSFDWALLYQRFAAQRFVSVRQDLMYAQALGCFAPQLLPVWLPFIYEQSANRLIRQFSLEAQDADSMRDVQVKIQGLLARIERSRFELPDLKLQLEETLASILNPVKKIATCYPKLNDLIVGFRPGSFYVIGARPGVGKTLVGVELAWQVSKSVPVAFFSLEMTKEDLLQRVYAQELNIKLDDMERGIVSPADQDRMEHLILNVDSQLFMSDPASLTISNIRRFVLKAREKHDLRVVFVDYLQLVTDESKDTLRERISKISIGLKSLAKEFGISVVALAQVNRRAGDDERPMASDLKESGQIEQDADVIVMLSRQASALDEQNAKSQQTFSNLNEDIPVTKSLMLLDVVKNRHGNKGSFLMTVIGNNSRLGPF